MASYGMSVWGLRIFIFCTESQWLDNLHKLLKCKASKLLFFWFLGFCRKLLPSALNLYSQKVTLKGHVWCIPKTGTDEDGIETAAAVLHGRTSGHFGLCLHWSPLSPEWHPRAHGKFACQWLLVIPQWLSSHPIDGLLGQLGGETDKA